jgi:hypothetical protein
VGTITSAVLFGALTFAVSYILWLAFVAVPITIAGGDGVVIFVASAVLAAITGAAFGFDYWRTKRRGGDTYWQKIVGRN